MNEHFGADAQQPHTGEVIRADGLGMTYAEGKLHTPVFDGLDFAVHAGETVAILGASGAGKSTLLHLLGGLDTPTAGEVYVAGQKMSALSDAARGKLRNRALGFVYQFHYLLPEFTALMNVMLPALRLGKYSKEEVEERAIQKLRMVEMDEYALKHASKLSGGQQQRVAIARALINDPAIIMGDEPTGNLDKTNSNKVFDIFKELAQENNQTIITVTHDMDFANGSDRIIEMQDGQVLDIRTPQR